jgi:hypothetical protein
MTSIAPAQVEITLDGEPAVLKCTLEAAIAISAQFGGFMNAHQRVVAQELDAMAAIVRHGIGADAKETSAIRTKVYLGGSAKLLAPLSRYVLLLMSGGAEVGEG